MLFKGVTHQKPLIDMRVRQTERGKGSETQRPEIESRGARIPSRQVSQAKHLLRPCGPASLTIPS